MIRNYKFGVDLDNTLNCSGNQFYPKLTDDELAEIVEKSKCFVPKKGIEVLSDLDLNVTIITGRGECFRDVTIEWLVNNDVPFREVVIIRNYEDNVFDKNLYLKHKKDAYLSRGIHFALDDDEDVVNMLNNCGVKAVKVDEDFREAFNKLFE